MRITVPFFVYARSGQRWPQLMTQAVHSYTPKSATAFATAAASGDEANPAAASRAEAVSTRRRETGRSNTVFSFILGSLIYLSVR